jgi:radical SAM protein with 4Fe4S-binding SPASM domain
MFYLKTTETCNLNCKHCFTNGTSGPKVFWNTDLVIDWIKRFSSQIKKDDTLHCEFHGGEPFLVPVEQLIKVHEETKKFIPNASWGITSNLTFKMYDEHFDFIEKYLDNRIGTSWDPDIRFSSPKQYDLWRKNVETLVNKGVTVKLFISVTTSTIKMEPIDLLEWVRDLGVKEMSLERLTNNGNAKLYPEIFPLNKEQDAWFLKMHEQSNLNNSRSWFDNEFLETVYDKFETGFVRGGTFCRDCEEKIFTLNADGSISGCPNSAPEFQFGSITDPIENLINSPIRLNTIACERSGNELCYSCDVFEYCGGDCHQLSWQDDICGAPKSLMQHLKYEKSTQTKVSKKIWVIKNGNIN